MAEQRVPTVRLDDDGSFEPAPPGYPYACFLEVLPECRSGRGRFYRKNAQGYTNFPAQAGMWTGQAAFDRANPDKCYPVPVSSVVDALLETVRILQEAL